MYMIHEKIQEYTTTQAKDEKHTAIHLPVRVVLVVAPSLRGTMTLSYRSPAKVLYTTW